MRLPCKPKRQNLYSHLLTVYVFDRGSGENLLTYCIS